MSKNEITKISQKELCKSNYDNLDNNPNTDIPNILNEIKYENDVLDELNFINKIKDIEQGIEDERTSEEYFIKLQLQDLALAIFSVTSNYIFIMNFKAYYLLLFIMKIT
jgi:hypothetical protein